jgi:hypothetical protein
MGRFHLMQKDPEMFQDLSRINVLEYVKNGKCTSHLTNKSPEVVVDYILTLGYSLMDIVENGLNDFQSPCTNCTKKCWRLKENVPLNNEEVAEIFEIARERQLQEEEGEAYTLINIIMDYS